MSKQSVLGLILLGVIGCAPSAPPALPPHSLMPPHPSTLRPTRLFSHSPEWARQMMPMSQADLAMAVFCQWETVTQARAAKKAVGSYEEPTLADQGDYQQVLSEIVRPGWRLDNWVLQVRYKLSRGSADSDHPRYPRQGEPPPDVPYTELILEFPQELGGFGVCLAATNYDFADARTTLSQKAFAGIEAEDWVRFSAVGGPGARPEWADGKDLGGMCIKGLTLTKLERIAPPAPAPPDFDPRSPTSAVPDGP